MMKTNKEYTKRLCLLGLILLSFNAYADPSMSASGVQTSPLATKYVCKNASVSLEISGEDRASPEGYAYESTSYSWGAGGSGSSATGSLTTSAPGDFTPSCTLTHTHYCIEGPGSTTTTETATLSYSIKVVNHATTACTPPSPQPANPVPLTGTTTTNNEDYDSYTDPDTGDTFVQYVNGTWSGISGEETFVADGDPTTGPECSAELVPPTKQGDSYDIGASWGPPSSGAAISISKSYTAPSYQPSTIAAQEFKRPSHQLYRQKISLTDATFNGTTYERRAEVFFGFTFPYGPQLNVQQLNGEQTLSGSPYNAGYTGKHCYTDCCPGNGSGV